MVIKATKLVKPQDQPTSENKLGNSESGGAFGTQLWTGTDIWCFIKTDKALNYMSKLGFSAAWREGGVPYQNPYILQMFFFRW